MDCPVWWDEKMAAAVAADVRSVLLLQEVVSYTVKQYCYKIRKIEYLKIVICIIKMVYCWLCIRFCIIFL
jgi:hypothetical protein